jgi:hypothetical protein
MFSDMPDESLSRLCDAFESLGNSTAAANLRRRLLHKAAPEERPSPRWLDNYPVLREVVHVAGYAAWAWRRAG